MTRLDPSPRRPHPQTWMEEGRRRDSYGRNTGMVGEKVRESSIHSLKRAGSSHSLRGDSPPPPFRHLEVGHPLPSTRIPEPKALIPFRNPDLGIPSKMRGPDAGMQGRSPSPPKYSQHSNFRRCSQGRGSPHSPKPRHTLIPTPFKQAELNAVRQARSNSRSKTRLPSCSSSGMARSPRRGSIFSPSSSPSRSPSPFKQNESPYSSYDAIQFSERQKEEFRSPSQSSSEPVLDSEYLYENLNLIARTVGSDSFSCKTEVDNPSHVHSPDGQSHSHTCGDHPPNHVPTQSQHNPGRGFDSRSLSQSLQFCCGALETNGRPMSRSSTERDLAERSPSPGYAGSAHQNRSPSPWRRRDSSSVSSSESECSRISGGSDSGEMNMKEYVVMADLPKAKIIYPREELWQRGRGQNHSPLREELRRLSEQTRVAEGHQEWGNSVERGRQKERGRKRQKRLRPARDRTPCAHGATSLPSPLGDTKDENPSEVGQEEGTPVEKARFALAYLRTP